jgi:nitroreductase
MSTEEPQSFIDYRPEKHTIEEMLEQTERFRHTMQLRRSVRQFSSEHVPYSIIRAAIHAAGTAPSGANKQPWTYCVVSNPDIKKQIRIAAEEEEFESYNGRMNKDWIDDLRPLGTDHIKPFLEDAPYLIIVFKRIYEMADGIKRNNYYVNESVGISVGMLITALHIGGLAALTHTPSPMNFLSKILNRPENERPFLLIPVGFPSHHAQVPDIARKSADAIIAEYF